MVGIGKFRRWRFSFHRFSSAAAKKSPPEEFLCPISRSLMSDPVVVSSGQTFERVCVNVCRDLGFAPTLADGSTPDFSTVIPNLALKTAILNWCSKKGLDSPNQPGYSDVESLVRSGMSSAAKVRELLKGVVERPPFLHGHASTELNPSNSYYSSSSEESVIANMTPLLPFATRPPCFSYSSSPSTSSEFTLPGEASSTNVSSSSCSGEDEGFVTKMNSLDVSDQEQAVSLLRKTTRTSEEARISLCSEKILICLKKLLDSRYPTVKMNAAAAVVNLSLEKGNKMKIVRCGIAPLLIDILKNGCVESREHAAGAIFSLALAEENKTAIGVLGAIPALLHELRSGTRRSRHDSALALYHLTLVSSNRAKAVRIGAARPLLGMLSNADEAARVVLIVCNLAACGEGRAALLDAGGVRCLVNALAESKTEFTRENCVAALHSLSQGSLRFRGLAREAGAEVVLLEAAESCGERAREKVVRILEMLKAPVEAGEVDWEAVMRDGVSGARCRPSQRTNST